MLKSKEFEKDIVTLDLCVESDVQLFPLNDYTSSIISYATGIDSTGAVYWALIHLDSKRTRMFLQYCDTGMEYDINIKLFYETSEKFDLPPILLKNKEDFMDILKKRKMWPDQKNRWCTAYLKTGVTNHWIRTHLDIFGEKCLFITGERCEESPRRAKFPEVSIHSTTLKKTLGSLWMDVTGEVWDRECEDAPRGIVV